MIVFFVTYDLQSSRVRKQMTGRPRWNKHAGNVAFVGAQIHLLRDDGMTVFRRCRKCTLFDDSCQPPRLIREDYELKFLRKLKAPLPSAYLDTSGNIVDVTGNIVDVTGNVVMEGPRT